MLQWIEIATKLFNTDGRCCEWFMNTMADDDWWPQQILIKCPNHTVRQVSFHRLSSIIYKLLLYHRLRGSASPVLTATHRSYGSLV